MTRRRVIFVGDDYWTNPPKENTMTDTPAPFSPDLVELTNFETLHLVDGPEAISLGMWFGTAEDPDRRMLMLTLKTKQGAFVMQLDMRDLENLRGQIRAAATALQSPDFIEQAATRVRFQEIADQITGDPDDTDDQEAQ